MSLSPIPHAPTLCTRVLMHSSPCIPTDESHLVPLSRPVSVFYHKLNIITEPYYYFSHFSADSAELLQKRRSVCWIKRAMTERLAEVNPV